ncbi:MAG: MFS transporter [Holosporaceae bacterium]|nr:MFS transporter [Holosporaceae bacterium]
MKSSDKENQDELTKCRSSKNSSNSSLIQRFSFFYRIFSTFNSLPQGIFAVSLFGLFLGAATTMVYSNLGLFMKNELHASEATISSIDGIVESIAYIVRIFSGAVSDYFCNRKAILIIGCAISLLTKPLFAIANSSLMILFAQSIERIGNGIQAVPRDSLIADLSSKEKRGQSFGFSRSLKTIGSALGTVLGMWIMFLSCNNYRVVFFCSTFAVAIAIALLYKVKTPQELRETKKENTSPKKMENPFQKKYLRSLDVHFWKLLTLAFVFEMGHFSESLFPIFAHEFTSLGTASSASIFISIGQVACSYPIGLYADRLGKAKFIKICILMMIAANLFFLTANSIVNIYIGAFLWGGQMTAVQGLFLSLITERVDSHLRGTAIGVYYCTIGLSFFLSSIFAGNIWTSYGHDFAFLYSICFCCLALFIFNILLPKKCEVRS